MAISSADVREKVAENLRRFREWAKLHRFWFEAGSVTVLSLLVLAAIGGIALRRASAWQEQAQRLRAIESAGTHLLTAFQAPDSTELAAWAESERMLRDLSLLSGAPLSTASVVAERAEEVGIYSTAVELIPGDTASVPGSFGFGSWSATTRPPTIGVQFVADLSGISRMIGALPPNVEVASLRVTPTGSRFRADLRLVPRTLQGPS